MVRALLAFVSPLRCVSPLRLHAEGGVNDASVLRIGLLIRRGHPQRLRTHVAGGGVVRQGEQRGHGLSDVRVRLAEKDHEVVLLSGGGECRVVPNGKEVRHLALEKGGDGPEELNVNAPLPGEELAKKRLRPVDRRRQLHLAVPALLPEVVDPTAKPRG